MMSCVGSLILASFVEDNKFGAVANEIVAETNLELLPTNVVTFSSRLLKNLADDASLLESTGKCKKTDDDVVLKHQPCTHCIEKQIGVDHK